MALRFEVPQFIDIQDKIFGPFTLQQFLFMAGGAGLAYIATKAIPTFIRYPIALALLIFGLMMAFYKVNGRTFPQVLQAFFVYAVGSKIFVWRQRPIAPPPTPKTTKKKKDIAPPPASEPVTDQTLRDLAWNLDILDSRKNKVQ